MLHLNTPTSRWLCGVETHPKMGLIVPPPPLEGVAMLEISQHNPLKLKVFI